MYLAIGGWFILSVIVGNVDDFILRQDAMFIILRFALQQLRLSPCLMWVGGLGISWDVRVFALRNIPFGNSDVAKASD